MISSAHLNKATRKRDIITGQTICKISLLEPIAEDISWPKG